MARLNGGGGAFPTAMQTYIQPLITLKLYFFKQKKILDREGY